MALSRKRNALAGGRRVMLIENTASKIKRRSTQRCILIDGKRMNGNARMAKGRSGHQAKHRRRVKITAVLPTSVNRTEVGFCPVHFGFKS